MKLFDFSFTMSKDSWKKLFLCDRLIKNKQNVEQSGAECAKLNRNI